MVEDARKMQEEYENEQKKQRDKILEVGDYLQVCVSHVFVEVFTLFFFRFFCSLFHWLDFHFKLITDLSNNIKFALYV